MDLISLSGNILIKPFHLKLRVLDNKIYLHLLNFLIKLINQQNLKNNYLNNIYKIILINKKNNKISLLIIKFTIMLNHKLLFIQVIIVGLITTI